MNFQINDLVETKRGVRGRVVKISHGVAWLKLANRTELYTTNNQSIVRVITDKSHHRVSTVVGNMPVKSHIIITKNNEPIYEGSSFNALNSVFANRIVRYTRSVGSITYIEI